MILGAGLVAGRAGWGAVVWGARWAGEVNRRREGWAGGWGMNVGWL